MKLLLLPAALLGLAACSQTPPAPMAPLAAAPSPTVSNFGSRPPDNPTGSQAIQSPDLSNRTRPPGGP